jgi:translation initiation factor 2-alpha kinase 4
LVASFDAAVLRSDGIRIVQELWANEISAELAVDASSLEELLIRYKDDNHSWIVIVKQDSKERGLRVKSMGRKEDSDVRSSELAGWLRSEIRARKHREGVLDGAKLSKHPSQQESNLTAREREPDVRILSTQQRNKKTNRRNITEAGELKSPA